MRGLVDGGARDASRHHLAGARGEFRRRGRQRAKRVPTLISGCHPAPPSFSNSSDRTCSIRRKRNRLNRKGRKGRKEGREIVRRNEKGEILAFLVPSH